MNNYKTKELVSFFSQFKTRNYKKREILIRADDEPQGVLFLRNGLVRQYIISETGIELTLHILKPFSIFPMVWSIKATPNLYYFEAMTPVEVSRAPREAVIKFLKDKSNPMFDVMSELAERYEETLHRIQHMVFGDAYRRVISTLFYIAENFGEKNGKGIVINQRFTQHDIANLAGIARETCTKEIVKLEKTGMVKYVKHTIHLENIKKLEEELSFTVNKED